MRNNLMPFQGPRLVFFMVVMLSAFVILVLRLYEWQFTDYTQLSANANENSTQSVPLPAPRGVIYDRFGVGLALNSPAFNVSVVPAGLPDDQDQALAVLNRLSALIDVPATRAAADAAGKKTIRSLDEMVKEGQGIAPYRPVVVKTDIPQAVAQNILEDNQNLPGVSVDQPVAVRQYPNGATTAQIVGYLGPIGEDEAKILRDQGYNPAFERVGYAGVEAYLDTELAGKRGVLTQTVDVAGLPVRVIKRDEPVAGRNVRLSIDVELQKAAQQALSYQIDQINTAAHSTVTQSGVVIAMNPNNGQILAMVSWPSYDNSRFARAIDVDYYLRVLNDPTKPLANNAISSLYPPGSVWKLLTASAVAQEKVIAPNSFLFDSGELFVNNSFAVNDLATRQKFVCWIKGGHGKVDLIHAIAWSCDVYFYQVGGGNDDVSPQTLRPGGLGIDNLDRYATMFGIGTKLGVELPGELSGRMPDPDWKRRIYGESWSTGDTYNASFGQGYVTVTPLQLLNAAASIVNGGTVFQPTLLDSWIDSAGNTLQRPTPSIDRTLILPPEGTPAVLNEREDLFIHGKDSITCICDQNSPYNDKENALYDPEQFKRCTDEFKKNYIAKVCLGTKDDKGTCSGREVTYTVNSPTGYSYRNLCDPLQYKFTQDTGANKVTTYQDYQPPFVDPENLDLVRQGMHLAVTDPGGTALKGMAGVNFDPAGKTGTAEYCDNIAAKQGLCISGSWPAHAWFVGYAPFTKPEIIVVAFIYHGNEGSANSLPIVKRVLSCYFKLKQLRDPNTGALPPLGESESSHCPITQ
ncbi:MAG: penicillin-binding protein 2 [Chloroflexota bacterium]